MACAYKVGGSDVDGAEEDVALERVSGIGGFFFRARDPSGLAAWYAEHLGVEPPPASYDVPSWWQQPGPTVFAGMEDGGHFGGPEHSWSINFRVPDLDAMVQQLRRAGIEVEVDAQIYPNGMFASLCDPEDNIIQLWEAAGADA